MSLDARFTDEDLREDATRWQDFGFFFQVQCSAVQCGMQCKECGEMYCNVT